LLFSWVKLPAGQLLCEVDLVGSWLGLLDCELIYWVGLISLSQFSSNIIWNLIWVMNRSTTRIVRGCLVLRLNLLFTEFQFYFFFAKIECGLYFLDRFDVLMSKMIFKNWKNIISIYFGTKSYLKSNHYHTAKHPLNPWDWIYLLYDLIWKKFNFKLIKNNLIIMLELRNSSLRLPNIANDDIVNDILM